MAEETSKRLADLYLDLLEKTLTGMILEDPGYTASLTPSKESHYDRARRHQGMDWPVNAQTMVGIPRLRNLRNCIDSVIKENVLGDFIETGVWRGGACIYMRANLVVHGVEDRRVWVADSFQGLPPPDLERYPADESLPLHTIDVLAVSVDEVRKNFEKYDLLDDKVVFLEGYFKDTLASAPIDRLAILRLDGDLFESTIQALDALYHKVSPNGFVIIDDYALGPCKSAVDRFRREHDVAEPMEKIDGTAVFWKKAG